MILRDKNIPDNEKKEFVITPASVETAGRGSTSDKSTFERMNAKAYYDILKDTSFTKEELGFVKEEILKENYVITEKN